MKSKEIESHKFISIYFKNRKSWEIKFFTEKEKSRICVSTTHVFLKVSGNSHIIKIDCVIIKDGWVPWRKLRIETHSEPIRTIPNHPDICIRTNANQSEKRFESRLLKTLEN